MPKTKARKKSRASSVASSASQNVAATPVAQKQSTAQRAGALSPSSQSLLTAGVVTLGCWGFAFTFIFLTSDPNRFLYGGMAAIIALMWSILFASRLQKWQRSRQA